MERPPHLFARIRGGLSETSPEQSHNHKRSHSRVAIVTTDTHHSNQGYNRTVSCMLNLVNTVI